MNHAGVEWARDHGAQIVRLAVEDNNEAARSQVIRLGYREESVWVWGNGTPQQVEDLAQTDRLKPSHATDVDAAWMFWASSDLVVAAHELLATGWLWKRFRVDHLREMQASHQLLQNAAGWLTATPTESGFLIDFAATAQADAPRLLRAVMAYGAETRVEQINIKMPQTAWSEEALTRAGFDTGGVSIFSKTT